MGVSVPAPVQRRPAAVPSAPEGSPRHDLPFPAFPPIFAKWDWWLSAGFPQQLAIRFHRFSNEGSRRDLTQFHAARLSFRLLFFLFFLRVGEGTESSHASKVS